MLRHATRVQGERARIHHIVDTIAFVFDAFRAFKMLLSLILELVLHGLNGVAGMLPIGCLLLVGGARVGVLLFL